MRSILIKHVEPKAAALVNRLLAGVLFFVLMAILTLLHAGCRWPVYLPPVLTNSVALAMTNFVIVTNAAPLIITSPAPVIVTVTSAAPIIKITNLFSNSFPITLTNLVTPPGNPPSGKPNAPPPTPPTPVPKDPNAPGGEVPLLVSNQFVGLKATGGQTRGVVAGALLKLTLSAPLVNGQTCLITITNWSGNGSETNLLVHEVMTNELIVEVPANLGRGDYEVNASLRQQGGKESTVLMWPHFLRVERLECICLLATLPLFVVAIVIFAVLRFFYDPGPNRQRLAWYKLLFVDPSTWTYSLSRTQFILWTAALSWVYVFIFIARGLVEDVWTFPSLTGFGMTFLISLGTLIGAQATAQIKGSKGAGDIEPVLSDLLVHGGVLALERVQEFLWTIIGIGLFTTAVVKNYAISTEIPRIPDELLYLMGLSSAGYLAGKLVRKPGPIITSVTASPGGSVLLNIQGQHLGRDAGFWVDDVKLPVKPVVKTADPDTPDEFAQELQVLLADEATVQTWFGRTHSLVIINADQQRAEWRSVPVILKVDELPEGQLIVTGEYLGLKPEFEVDGAELVSFTQQEPSVWRISLKPRTAKGPPYEELRVRDDGHRQASYKWKPGLVRQGVVT